MTDGHIERGPYTTDRIRQYANRNSGAARSCPETAFPGIAPELLHILKKHGAEIITSSDARCPEDIGRRIREPERLVSGA